MTSFPSTILSLFFGHTSKDSKEDRRGKDWGGRDAREVSGEQDLGNADNIPDNVSEEISSSRSPSPETSSGPDAERTDAAAPVDPANTGIDVSPEQASAAYIAVEFASEKSAGECLGFFLAKYPERRIYMPSPRALVVQRAMKDELEAHLVAKGYPYEIVPVRSVGDLPPEQAARRRRPGRRTTSPLRTKEGLLAALKELEEPSKK